MSIVVELRARAERCRTSTFATPVVSTVDEARQLAWQIADQLVGLSGREALLYLSSLHDVDAVLAARVSRLQGEMASARHQLRLVGEAGRACRSYGVAAGSLRPHRPSDIA
jgi:hypothetical protein